MKRNILLLLVSFLLSLTNASCQSYTHEIFQHTANQTILIDSIIDLHNRTLKLEDKVTLRFLNGGRISNGVLEGSSTKIEGLTKGIFDNITINGSWNTAHVTTTMFVNPRENNCLVNLFSMANDSISNVVFIEEGEYIVSTNKEYQSILNVPSKTEVICNGTIKMLPNPYTNYYILNLKGNNIWVHGKGSIIGDKDNHLGTAGEWGMGIAINGGHNIRITDMSVKDCWGDCIYIRDDADSVYINNCTLINGRRQGISIVSSGTVVIENCIIKDVEGTQPQFAVDVEPNKGQTVKYVSLRNVKAVNCAGGFMCYDKAENSKVIKYELINCEVEGKAEKGAYYFTDKSYVVIRDCINRGSIVENKN